MQQLFELRAIRETTKTTSPRPVITPATWVKIQDTIGSVPNDLRS